MFLISSQESDDQRGPQHNPHHKHVPQGLQFPQEEHRRSAGGAFYNKFFIYLEYKI